MVLKVEVLSASAATAAASAVESARSGEHTIQPDQLCRLLGGGQGTGIRDIGAQSRGRFR
jgi:hypothetical protein